MKPSALEITNLEATCLPERANKTRPPVVTRETPALRVIHVLRKCNPTEWGGTETAIQRLFEGLLQHGVASIVYCPRLDDEVPADPLSLAGCAVKRFGAFLPVFGLPPQQRQQLLAVGGNLMSLDLPGALWREPNVSVIHSHTLGRLGGIAATVARRRGVPFIATIHGGLLDLPDTLKSAFGRPTKRGWEWGRIFGFVLRSRQLVNDADAILTCNTKEAALLRERYPGKRIVVQPHGVPVNLYQADRRDQARVAFPEIRGRQVLLSVGRIDRVKNQGWLIEQAPAIFKRHPQALLVLAGSCTDEVYGESLQRRISELNLSGRVILTGGFPSADPRLIGLFQQARVVLLPSISETFGLVILEAWAAGTAVIASRTSGASALIQEGHNGWLFDLSDVGAFHEAVDAALLRPNLAAQFADEGARLVQAEYDCVALAGRMKNLYQQLVEAKHALRHSTR
jgi:glycosyltransferase involved in cell wall biosynthesis